MKLSKLKFIIIASITLVIATVALILMQGNSPTQLTHQDPIHSPYVGQENRDIKALSQDDIEGLLAGAGTPFGGMAKPAELNGYPGPRHVLDAYEAGQFDLTGDQLEQIEALYEEMRIRAIELGTQIVDLEKGLDDAFKSGTVTESLLQEEVEESAELYGQLRAVHLSYHLLMVNILTPQQVEEYNDLRGYTSGNPCESVPEGHDPEMWKLHNNCE